MLLLLHIMSFGLILNVYHAIGKSWESHHDEARHLNAHTRLFLDLWKCAGLNRTNLQYIYFTLKLTEFVPFSKDVPLKKLKSMSCHFPPYKEDKKQKRLHEIKQHDKCRKKEERYTFVERRCIKEIQYQKMQRKELTQRYGLYRTMKLPLGHS